MRETYDGKEAEEVRQALLRAWFALVPGAGASGDEKADANRVAKLWSEDCVAVIRYDGGLMLGGGHLELKLPELIQGWIEKTLAAGA